MLHLLFIFRLSCMGAYITCAGREGPFLAGGLQVALRVIPGVDCGLPWWRGAVGSWRCHPGRIYPRDASAAFFSNRQVNEKESLLF